MIRRASHCITITGCLVAALFAIPVAQARESVTVTPAALPAAGAARVYKGVIRGNARAEYVFHAPAGRRLLVNLKTTNPSSYFNLVQDGKDEAMFVGAMGGNSVDVVLRDAGAYRVVVYLMRNAARRNEQAKFEVRLRTLARPDA
jgi:hypothetical protein